MIDYSFNFEKFVINEALFDQSPNEYLQKEMNSLLGSNIQYLANILIYLIQIRPKSL